MLAEFAPLVASFGLPGLAICVLGWLAYDRHKAAARQTDLRISDMRETANSHRETLRSLDRNTDAISALTIAVHSRRVEAEK